MSLDYPVEVRALPPEEGGGWLACIPVLGKHSFRATGDTQEEALKELGIIREVLIEDRYNRGEHIPTPPPLEEEYSGMPGLRLPKSVHRIVAQRAKEEGVSINSYLNSLIARGLGTDTAAHAVRKEVSVLRQDLRSLASCLVTYDIQQAPSPSISGGFVRTVGFTRETINEQEKQHNIYSNIRARA